MKKLLVSLLLPLLLFPFLAEAQNLEPVPPDQAFNITSKIGPDNTVMLNWKIAPKHYLYRDRFHFKVLKPPSAQIGRILLPEGIHKKDKIFGNYEVYYNTTTLSVPILNASSTEIIFQVSYQGCSESGYCYPPEVKTYQINFQTHHITPYFIETETTQGKISHLLASKNLIAILLSFFGFGLLLSLTPCVLPMLPILSTIIVGHSKKISAAKGFWLSLCYVLGMAVAYAIAGLAIGSLGESLQAILQLPWIIALFSLIFVILALSMFGFYQLHLPKRFEEKLHKLSNQQKHGHYISVFIMGLIASLIISPCVTPALVGALSYIIHSGNALLGASALFVMGVGMGIPLLIIGTVGGKLLPKAGSWMQTINNFFGVLMLAVAIWLLSRVIPGPVTLLLWATLLVITAIFLKALKKARDNRFEKFCKGIGFILLIYGATLIVGATMGNSNPLQPLAGITGNKSNNQQNEFISVKNIQEVRTAINNATKQKRFVTLDFYADWCIACKEMDATTFQNAQVKLMLENFVKLRADVTANDPENKALEKYFNVIAPPTIIFFDPHGQLLKSMTLVGKTGSQDFLKHLQKVLSTPH